MSHTMKLYERIIERRVRGETLVGDEQFGFMPGENTSDAIFALRQFGKFDLGRFGKSV